MLVAEGLESRPVIRAAATRPLRVLVVDDHEVARNGLRWLLTRVAWVEHCVVAGRRGRAAERAVDAVRRRARRRRPRPRALRAAEPPTMRVALLTSRWDDVSMRTARAAGAAGVIEKERPARELLRAVHTLASRRRRRTRARRCPARSGSSRASARSCAWSERGSRTPRSAPRCSSRRGRSSTTCSRSTRSSARRIAPRPSTPLAGLGVLADPEPLPPRRSRHARCACW